MSWCLARAVNSCLVQSMRVNEIIIVDDCSLDNTAALIPNLMATDSRIRYFRTEKNGGHLAAVRLGIQRAVSEWVALLDGDDELTPHSIEARVKAALEYKNKAGVTPQLVYGDSQGSSKFAQLKGYVYPYLCKELCLCNTSTMMLGRESLRFFPAGNPFNSDDEIVLTLGRLFHVVHSGVVVAIYHQHDSPARMGNDIRRRYEGVCELVRNHRDDIVREQGRRRLFLWRVRILKAFISYQISLASVRIDRLRKEPTKRLQCLLLRAYRTCLARMSLLLIFFLRRSFEYDFF
jgi:glycosyltransferase involved in cell wall biosynthesis